jgi:hypothetical protein
MVHSFGMFYTNMVTKLVTKLIIPNWNIYHLGDHFGVLFGAYVAYMVHFCP